MRMMMSRFVSMSAVVAFLVSASPCWAQVYGTPGSSYTSSVNYNPYTGATTQGKSTHNSYTGNTSAKGKSTNPYTGTTRAGSANHNSYTGSGSAHGRAYNSYTGSARAGGVSH